MKVLITSGGCKAPIDSVRHIGNSSSGKYGCALFEEFFTTLEYEDRIIFFYEKGSELPAEVWWWDVSGNGEVSAEFRSYKYYEDYLKVKGLIKNMQPDIIVSVAAISDYIPIKQEGKISSDKDELVIPCVRSEKVIRSFRDLAPNALVVGFKLLDNPSECEKEEAIQKALKYSDIVVYNDISKLRQGDSRRYVYRGMEYAPTMVKTPGDLVEYIIQFKKEPY